MQKAIDAILQAHARSPAILVNRRYDILDTNAAAKRLMAGMATPDARSRQPNLLRLILSPDCLRPSIENWQELSASLIRRVWRESEGIPTLRGELLCILDESVADGGRALLKTSGEVPPDVMLPMRIRTPDFTLALFSTITTLGTPTDITLQELRIEAFHPADRKSEEWLAGVVGR